MMVLPWMGLKQTSYHELPVPGHLEDETSLSAAERHSGYSPVLACEYLRRTEDILESGGQLSLF